MTTDFVTIRRALLSATDKTGLVPLAEALLEAGVQLISTGGTRKLLTDAGLPVTDIAQVTGNPEAFGGRMKTISFQVASALLFDRDRDAAEAARLGVQPIDLVVANLYDFAGHQELGLPLHELIEHIDIGGPTMIRAAAKNYAGVAVLTDPGQYAGFVQEFRQNAGATSLQSRQKWMTEAFALTARYDTLISHHLAGQPLRYGENPHQRAVFVPDRAGVQLQVLAGKEMSYNNLVDTDAALAAVLGLAEPACAVVKHENPCGLALSANVAELLQLAWAGDPVSAFGSVIAFNRPVGKGDLLHLAMDDKAQRKFVEIVAAPDFSADAVDYLRQNKNLRIVRFKVPEKAMAKTVRHLSTGALVQDADRLLAEKFELATADQTASVDRPLAEFGLHAVRCLKSNAIALVRRVLISKDTAALQLVGMGAGQPNRLKSVQLAVAQARDNLAKADLGECLLASDAFFPFADGVQVALDAGVRVVVQPGGSLRDGEVVAACNAAGAALIFTGTRHFKH